MGESFRIRPPTEADAEAVTELVVAFDVEEYGTPDFELDDLLADWGSPGLDLERDAWLAEDADGSLAAYAALHFNDNAEAYVRAASRGLGIGDALRQRIEARALERTAAGTRVLVGQALSSVNNAGRALLLRAGYADVRTYWRLVRPLADDIPPAMPPAGVTIRPFERERDAHETHRVMGAAFEDNIRRRPFESFEEWEAHEINRKAFDPSLWFVAEAEGEIVGAIVCPDYEGEGWIRQLGVARDWRGRGIGTALVLTAFAEFKRRGRRDSALVVDSWNRTGAKRVYERLGMRPERTHSRFEKELRPGG
ncbi:MAG TPA: GNAT family N-acetyltransferase [Gaiellaceae bacterium]|nr:GNAT family N-acetyltransferase [Gaiellaceae bacterium]